ncbi:MAG: hypothetical protein HDR88_04605 [Bacteroides sp.]|nr:hypothetical protein [Bacteroides sp.]
MKKMLFAFTATCVASMGLAVETVQFTVDNGLILPEGGQKFFTERISQDNVCFTDMPSLSGFKTAPMKDSGTQTVIQEAPAGDVVEYTRSGVGFNMYGYFGWWNTKYERRTIIYADDSYAYIHNPFLGWTTNSYLKCQVNGDKLVAELPQAIYQEVYNGDTYVYYADLLYKQVDADGNIRYTASDSDEQKTVSWTIDGDKITLDLEYDATPGEDGSLPYPDVIFGLENANGAFFGDCLQTFEKVDYKFVDAPEGLALEDWVYINNYYGRTIKVGFDGNDVYFGGLYGWLPNALVKGSLIDDQIIIDSKQYIGTIFGWYIFFMGGTSNDAGSYDLVNNITLRYDAEKHEIKADEGVAMLINAGFESLYAIDALVAPQFNVLNSDPSPIPCNPIPTQYFKYFEYFGYDQYQFILPNVNKENELLDEENMYYEVYIDNDLWTFEPSEEYPLEEPMSQIPYTFMANNSFSYNGATHYMNIWFTDFDTVGLKLYNVVDGETYASDMVISNINTGEVTTVPDSSGVMQVDAVKEVSSVEYYNLQGVKIAAPSDGLFVKIIRYTDGTSKSCKVWKK